MKWSMNSRTPRWSDLPKELLATIAKHFDTHSDVLLFRSVCSSWRSSLTSLSILSPPLSSIKLPFPIAPNSALDPTLCGYFSVIESTVYYIEPLLKNPNASASASKGWLVEVRKEKSGKMRLLNPLSKVFVNPRKPNNLPEVLNLLNFQIYEVEKVYNLQFVDHRKNHDTSFKELKLLNPTKVAVSSSPSGTGVADDYAIMTIHGGKLGYLKLADHKWSTFDDGQQNPHYDDIVYYKRQFYAVDHTGRVLVIDSSLKSREISSPVRHRVSLQLRHLVESSGDLFLVDLDLEFYGRDELGDFNCPFHIDVYKLNDGENEWVPVKTLGDRAFFVGADCSFSVSARDFPACGENCIYFGEYFFSYWYSDDDDRPGYDAVVYDLKYHSVWQASSFYPDYSEIFWPPPAWLR